MGSRLLVVRKGHRGCTLYYDGKPLAWYPHPDQAMAMARLLAETDELRTGHRAQVLLGSHGQARPAPDPATPLP
jgi:hypothetical protein